MKALATVNFKGGVGKTTVTWLLAKFASDYKKKKVLVFDSDAQMSLTLTVQLQEDSGTFQSEFEKWYENHKARHKTILDAIDKYDSSKDGYFDFPIDLNFIYKMNDNLHFVPSVVDLYWLELEVFKREKIKNFIRALLEKIEHTLPYKYDYVFFDCPPNFTALSYSILSCISIILIPVNPDVFASRGVELIIDGLVSRIQPWPNPKIVVFMNKARLRNDQLTRETLNYLSATKEVCDKKKSEGIDVILLNDIIPERVDIKRAIPGSYFPKDYIRYFNSLWESITKIF
ncbi:MAG TPA: ParA family protein [Caldisericia bacterium]|nr:ParA family protein [Caldisericia bacterium]HQL67319.1 ParA family protein [Caldisericia bacterium]HQN48794.1 ParA family protein [Caldisericia bacterium]HQO99668.1 ParA family protein [Caldisericia bacterium]